MEQLSDKGRKDIWVKQLLAEKERLASALATLEIVKNVLPSDANFLMARFENARDVFEYLIDKGIIVRDRSGVALCEGYLRITVGTPEENDTLLDALNKWTDNKNRQK
jgi:histidinol-phosphate aminotransferase